MHRSTIGVGPALRKARQARGVSIAEASRDTMIRQELIRALETEDFDRLLGDVYVRGALRSYSTYLGLPADRVLSRYTSAVGEHEPAAAGPPLVSEAVVGAPRRRDNHRLVAMIAATVVVLAAAFGILSTRGSAPPPPTSPVENPLAEAIGPGISVSVSTAVAVDVTIRVDSGPPEFFTLLPGESRAFEANLSLTIRLSRGGTADVVVAGRDLGTPGRPDRPWTRTFSYRAATDEPSTGG